MTFAFPLLAMGQTAVACAIYADMIAALKEKRPLASHQSLGYTAEAQPLAAQPPSAYSQHQVRINLKNAVVSLTMNSVPVGMVQADTNLSMVSPLIGWLANGANTLGVSARALSDDASATVEVARMAAKGEPQTIGTLEWSAAAPDGTIALEGEGLPEWAWQVAEQRTGEEAAVEQAAMAFLAAAAAGDRTMFDSAFGPVMADLGQFYGGAIAQQGTEQIWGMVQEEAAKDPAPKLTVEAVGDGRFYRVRRADGTSLIGMPDSDNTLRLPPGKL
jgi:hypothetical protein